MTQSSRVTRGLSKRSQDGWPLRAIELEENTERLDLDSYEASKQRLAMIRAEEAAAKVEEEFRDKSSQNSRRSKRGRVGEGRPKKPGSRADVAERTGVSPPEQRRTEEHVALAERYPVFQRPQWKKHNVIEAGVLLEKIPDRERAPVMALFDRDFVPPDAALPALRNLVTLDPSRRRAILRMAESDDRETRDKALTTAAATPPPLHSCHQYFNDIVRQLEHAARRKPFRVQSVAS